MVPLRPRQLDGASGCQLRNTACSRTVRVGVAAKQDPITGNDFFSQDREAPVRVATPKFRRSSPIHKELASPERTLSFPPRSETPNMRHDISAAQLVQQSTLDAIEDKYGGDTLPQNPDARKEHMYMRQAAEYQRAVNRAAQQLSSRANTRTEGGQASTTPVYASALQLPPDQTRPPIEPFAWAQEDADGTFRSAEIWKFFIKLRASLALLDAKWTYPGGYDAEARSARARELAMYTREKIQHLGPAFVKIGQMLSTRADLLLPEFMAEFAKLNENVAAFSPARAVGIVQLELGQPIDKLYKKFERNPIAAASLSQVHRATLWSGEVVAVKVQRPGLKRLFDMDLVTLKEIAEFLDKGDLKPDFSEILSELSTVLYRELDYGMEAKSAMRFKRMYEGCEWIKVPAVDLDLSSEHILTLEYLPGIPITDVARLLNAGMDTTNLAIRATDAYLTQILRHGFYHANPYPPGNLVVDKSGALVFTDFGMMGEISYQGREAMLSLVKGAADKDVQRVMDGMIDLDLINLEKIDQQDVYNAINMALVNGASNNPRSGVLGEDLFSIPIDEPYRMPAGLTAILRALASVEALGKNLDPEYKFIAVGGPFVRSLPESMEPDQGWQDNTGVVTLDRVQLAPDANGSIMLSEDTAAPLSRAAFREMETRDVKLRVSVPKSEQADRRSSAYQVAIINTVAVFGLVNLGSTFATNGSSGPAGACMAMSSVFAYMLVQSFEQIKQLDEMDSM